MSRENKGSNVEPGMVQRAAARLGQVFGAGGGAPGAPGDPVVPGVPTHAQAAAVQQTTIPGVDGAWMGPLNPLTPTAPTSVRARALDMLVGWNVTTNNQRLGQLDVISLRNLARNCDLINIAVDTRKDQLESGKFDFKLVDDALGFKSAQDPRIAELRKFFVYPDLRRPLARWIRKWVDDLLVVDAPCVWIQKNRAGKPYQMRVIDTGTIKPLLDSDGETPLPPAPAYQQWLKGVPTSDYASYSGAEPDSKMTFDEMLWHPRNPRPDTIFGWSPVEQIALTVNTAIRRQLMILAGYTDGTIPEALAPVPETWTTDKIGEFQIYWNEMIAGKFGEQRGIRFVPAGMEKAVFTKKWEDHAEFDEWLARIVMAAYRLPNTWAVKSNNRATAGAQNETAGDEGRLPYLNFVCEFMTILVHRGWGYKDIEVVFKDSATSNELSGAQAMNERMKFGGTTLNEERGASGHDPYDDPEADVPHIMTATGAVPIGVVLPAEPDPSAALGTDGKPAPVAKPKPGAAPVVDDAAVEKIADAVLRKIGKKKALTY